MKRIYQFVLLAAMFAVLPACHKDADFSTSTGTGSDYTTGLTNQFLWGRVVGVAGGASVGIASYTDSLGDTTFAMSRVSDSMINFIPPWPPLHLTNVNTTLYTATFDTILPGSYSAVLTYYYTVDSVTFEGHQYTDTASAVVDHYSFFRTRY